MQAASRQMHTANHEMLGNANSKQTKELVFNMRAQ